VKTGPRPRVLPRGRGGRGELSSEENHKRKAVSLKKSMEKRKEKDARAEKKEGKTRNALPERLKRTAENTTTRKIKNGGKCRYRGRVKRKGENEKAIVLGRSGGPKDQLQEKSKLETEL